VVADRQMPRMDGIAFLSAVRKSAPDTIRIMLTGNADLEGAIRVVNEGNIFRFLTKPCPPDMLTRALQDAQAQYRLVTAEKELLNKTLNGSIKLLTDILSMVDNQSFGRARTLRDAITAVTARLCVENAWEIHLAVMLASIGYVTIPPETLVKSHAGQPLSPVEEQMLARLPETAARLLANIPRLEGVARIVLYQHKHFDGSGFPMDSTAGESIPLGSRLLKILIDMMDAQGAGLTRLKALEKLQSQSGRYDPALLAAVRACNEGGQVGAVNAASESVRALHRSHPGHGVALQRRDPRGYPDPFRRPSA
jgi:response regulator RpfG family c-di-GMP phosphodiesterase